MSVVQSPDVPCSGLATAATAATAADAPLRWSQTRALIRADFARVVAMMGGGGWSRRAFWFLLPGTQALFWYRLARHAHLAGWRNLGWLLYLFNTYLTRIEIPPRTAIGAGCFIGHAPAVLCGRFGERFTLHGNGGTGGGMDERDIGGGPDLPVVGDDVVFAVRAMALGPIRIGDGARLGPSCTVTRDVPAGALVAAAPSRILKIPGAPCAAPTEAQC